MKSVSAIMGITVIAGITLLGGHAAAQQTINLSHNTAEGSSWQAGAERFKELVEKRSDGEYTVNIHPNARLANGSDRVELEMTQAGEIQFLIKSTTWLTGLDDRFQALGLPWLFPNHDVANAVLDSDAGQVLLDDLRTSNLVGLAWGVNGFRQVTNSERPIEEPEDLDGLRMRVPGIDLYLAIFDHLGASATTMNFAEVFTALQTGSVDGQENPLSLIHSSRFYDVQEHLTIWNYSYDALAFIAGAPFWEELSEEDRQMFAGAATDAMDYQREVVKREDNELVPVLEDEGMDVTKLSDEQIDVFRKSLEPVYNEYKEELGADFVERFETAVDRETSE